MEKYTIGAFAKKANVTTRTIRYYDQIGLLTPSIIGKNGYRYYVEEDLIKLQTIVLLKELGFSLEEISPMLLFKTGKKEFKQNIEMQLELVDQKIQYLSLLKDRLRSVSKYISNQDFEIDSILDLIQLSNIDQKLVLEYTTSTHLNARLELHQRYSTNPIGWFNWVFEQIDFSKVTRLLEVGCGNGALWQNRCVDVRNREIYLSDISQGMINEVKRNLHSDDYYYLVVDCEHIPFKDHYFDSVIANHVLFYLEHEEKGILEISRVLSNQGILYCSTYGKNHMKEITQLVNEFDPRIVLSNDLLYQKFGLENGKQILSKYFSSVEKRIYEDKLLVDDANIIVDYISSCKGNQKDLLIDRYDELIQFIQEKIDQDGNIEITKEVGLFVCQK